jgi:hypothetical protein
MATWKKVIVSGSNAELNGLLVNTNQQISSSVDTTFLSGSFSGSFHGDGSDLTGVSSSFISNTISSSYGIAPFSFNGSNSASVEVSGAVNLVAGNFTQWTGNAFASSSLYEYFDGFTMATYVTGASSIRLTGYTSILTGSFTGSFYGNGNGLTFTDNFSVTNGSASFGGDVIVSGDLIVNGTASFINSTNLLVKDRFTLFNSGSTSLTDTGFIFQDGFDTFNKSSGSAFYVESAYGNSGRFAIASGISYDTTDIMAPNNPSYMVSVVRDASNSVPTTEPYWGGTTAGYGNMYIQADSMNPALGEIWIYA